MDASSDIADFSRRDITLLGKTKPVLLTGATGPGVIVIHEVYGFAPTLARFIDQVTHIDLAGLGPAAGRHQLRVPARIPRSAATCLVHSMTARTSGSLMPSAPG